MGATRRKRSSCAVTDRTDLHGVRLRRKGKKVDRLKKGGCDGCKWNDIGACTSLDKCIRADEELERIVEETLKYEKAFLDVTYCRLLDLIVGDPPKKDMVKMAMGWKDPEERELQECKCKWCKWYAKIIYGSEELEWCPRN